MKVASNFQFPSLAEPTRVRPLRHASQKQGKKKEKFGKKRSPTPLGDERVFVVVLDLVLVLGLVLVELTPSLTFFKETIRYSLMEIPLGTDKTHNCTSEVLLK